MGIEKCILSAAATVIIVLILSITSCEMRRDAKIAEAIKNGVDPVYARLAYKDGFEARRAYAIIKAVDEQCK
jgi:hypothetical protein